MKYSTKKQAISRLVRDVQEKFKLVDELQSVSGIHLGDVMIIVCEGYGPSTYESMYTPSVLINVKLIVSRSSQGRLKINRLLIDDKEQNLPYGGEYISNVVNIIKNI